MSPVFAPTYVFSSGDLQWKSPGRNSIPAQYLGAPQWFSTKQDGGVVVVDSSRYGATSAAGVNHMVLKIPWSTVNPNIGVYDWSGVNDFLATFPNTYVTLRIQSGWMCPAWLAAATGTVNLTISSRSANPPVDCPHWWEEYAMAAWSTMIHQAGLVFDQHPRIVCVSADAPMVYYSEPYILGGNNTNAINLYNAGLTLSGHKAAISRCVDDTVDAFPNTLVELAIHGDLQYPTSTGMKYSWPEGRSLALAIANKHGRHIAFSDYGLASTDSLANHPITGTIETEPDAYSWMKIRSSGTTESWAGPVFFQLTVGQEPQTYDTYTNAVNAAISLGGIMCETAGWGNLNPDAAIRDQALKTNAAKWRQ